MGRPLHRLTDRRVKTAPPGQYSDGGNLYLIVAGPDSRHWSFVGKQDGKRREMGLGSLRAVEPCPCAGVGGAGTGRRCRRNRFHGGPAIPGGAAQ